MHNVVTYGEVVLALDPVLSLPISKKLAREAAVLFDTSIDKKFPAFDEDRSPFDSNRFDLDDLLLLIPAIFRNVFL